MKKERFLLLALCALILLSGCGTPQTEPPAANEPPAADTQTAEAPADPEPVPETEPAAEAAYCIFPSVEAMTDAVRSEQEAFWKDAAAYGNGLEDVSAVYVPTREYEGFRLHSVAVNPYYIFLYYIPLDSASDMVFDPEDIVITQSRSREMTLESVCAQHGIFPDEDGYAYSAKHGDLYFERDGTVIFISAPEGRNDYDSLRAMCELERVEIERYDSGIWDWDFETYGDDAPQIAMLGEENYRAYEQATSELGLSSRDAANQFCSDLTELGDLAGWTATERVKGDGGEYYLRVARLRSQCYDANKPTLAGKVASQYERFRNGDRQVLGPEPGPGQSRDDKELIYDLTGLTVFHPALSGVSIHVTVNEVDCGEFPLDDGETCTLIPLDLPEFVADRPVQINLWSTDLPKDAELRVYAGLDSNVSRSI